MKTKKINSYPTTEEIFGFIVESLCKEFEISSMNTNHVELFKSLSNYILYRNKVYNECRYIDGFDEEKFYSLLDNFKTSYRVIDNRCNSIKNA